MSLFYSLTFFCLVALSSSQIEFAQPQRLVMTEAELKVIAA